MIVPFYRTEMGQSTSLKSRFSFPYDDCNDKIYLISSLSFAWIVHSTVTNDVLMRVYNIYCSTVQDNYSLYVMQIGFSFTHNCSLYVRQMGLSFTHTTEGHFVNIALSTLVKDAKWMCLKKQLNINGNGLLVHWDYTLIIIICLKERLSIQGNGLPNQDTETIAW